MVSDVDEPTLDALTRFGRHLGMCFQIVDDVLDLTSTDEALGKPAGQDLLEGVYTLPVIYALEESDELRGLLGTPIDAERLPAARALATGERLGRRRARGGAGPRGEGERGARRRRRPRRRVSPRAVPPRRRPRHPRQVAQPPRAHRCHLQWPEAHEGGARAAP